MRDWIRREGEVLPFGMVSEVGEKLLEGVGDVSKFLDRFFQTDGMYIRSFEEKLLVFGVKRSGGKIFETVLRGHSVPSSHQRLRKPVGRLDRAPT